MGKKSKTSNGECRPNGPLIAGMNTALVGFYLPFFFYPSFLFLDHPGLVLSRSVFRAISFSQRSFKTFECLLKYTFFWPEGAITGR